MFINVYQCISYTSMAVSILNLVGDTVEACPNIWRPSGFNGKESIQIHYKKGRVILPSEVHWSWDSTIFNSWRWHSFMDGVPPCRPNGQDLGALMPPARTADESYGKENFCPALVLTQLWFCLKTVVLKMVTSTFASSVQMTLFIWGHPSKEPEISLSTKYNRLFADWIVLLLPVTPLLCELSWLSVWLGVQIMLMIIIYTDLYSLWNQYLWDHLPIYYIYLVQVHRKCLLKVPIYWEMQWELAFLGNSVRACSSGKG